MEDSEVFHALLQAKTSCQDCYRLSRTKLPPGAICSSPTREQVRASALGTLQKILSNGNGSSDEAAQAIAKCMRCDYRKPDGPRIFEYLKEQTM
jgi:hypothetical protein